MNSIEAHNQLLEKLERERLRRREEFDRKNHKIKWKIAEPAPAAKRAPRTRRRKRVKIRFRTALWLTGASFVCALGLLLIALLGEGPEGEAATIARRSRTLSGEFHYAQAADSFARSAQLVPSDPEYHFQAAWNYYLEASRLEGSGKDSAGHRQQADTFAKQALSVMPEYVPALDLMARLEVARGNFDGAATYYEQVAALEPDSKIGIKARNCLEILKTE